MCCDTIIATAAQFEQVENLLASATKEMRRDRLFGFYRSSGLNRRSAVNQRGTPKLFRRILSAGFF
jgi:hypothetical protein